MSPSSRVQGTPPFTTAIVGDEAAISMSIGVVNPVVTSTSPRLVVSPKTNNPGRQSGRAARHPALRAHLRESIHFATADIFILEFLFSRVSNHPETMILAGWEENLSPMLTKCSDCHSALKSFARLDEGQIGLYN